jgi:AcrR family transcriptional regulator
MGAAPAETARCRERPLSGFQYDALVDEHIETLGQESHNMSATHVQGLTFSRGRNMTGNISKPVQIRRRRPQQNRARQKIELIFEATMRLLHDGDIASLTTNAIAEKAGISIGTLYQYFGDKEGVLNALAQRELETLAAKVMRAMSESPRPGVQKRIELLTSAVLDSYGGRRRVHRLLFEHALTRGPGARLNPLYAAVVEQLGRGDLPKLTRSEAFVLTHAFGGVMRAVVANSGPSLKREELEAALARLVRGFLNETSQ